MDFCPNGDLQAERGDFTSSEEGAKSSSLPGLSHEVRPAWTPPGGSCRWLSSESEIIVRHHVIRTQHGLLERCFLRRCGCTDLTGTRRAEGMNQPGFANFN